LVAGGIKADFSRESAMSRCAVSLSLRLIAGSALAWGDDCEFTARREATLDPGIAEQLLVAAAAGDLTIRVEPGATGATAVGTACASSQELLDRITLVAGEVDSSGDIDFRRVRGSAIVGRDSSGSIRAESVGGDFIVRRDGSGGVSHREVAGRVDVPDDD
jgi:hypothetical protein